jgi:hypothetical protein
MCAPLFSSCQRVFPPQDRSFKFCKSLIQLQSHDFRNCLHSICSMQIAFGFLSADRLISRPWQQLPDPAHEHRPMHRHATPRTAAKAPRSPIQGSEQQQVHRCAPTKPLELPFAAVYRALAVPSVARLWVFHPGRGERKCQHAEVRLVPKSANQGTKPPGVGPSLAEANRISPKRKKFLLKLAVRIRVDVDVFTREWTSMTVSWIASRVPLLQVHRRTPLPRTPLRKHSLVVGGRSSQRRNKQTTLWKTPQARVFGRSKRFKTASKNARRYRRSKPLNQLQALKNPMPRMPILLGTGVG